MLILNRTATKNVLIEYLLIWITIMVIVVNDLRRFGDDVFIRKRNF